MDRNVNFIPKGKYIFYYDSDNKFKKLEAEYNEYGNLINTFKFYYPTNTLMYEVTFDDGIKQGLTRIYDNTGCIATELKYDNDVVREVRLFYNKGGAPVLYAIYSMNGASLDGPFNDYTKTGLTRRKGSYSYDNLSDNLKVFWENTSLLMVNKDYSGTGLICKETYDKSGNLLLKIGYGGSYNKTNVEQWFYGNIVNSKKVNYTFLNNTVEIIELR